MQNKQAKNECAIGQKTQNEKKKCDRDTGIHGDANC
jgi:hypothetical protein